MLRRYTRHAVVRNALSLYGIQAANYLLPFLTFPYVARVLGVAKFGQIGFAQAFVGYFLVLTEYGFNFSVTREVSIHRDQPEALRRIYSAAMTARFLLMLFSFIIMSLIVFTVPELRADWALYYISFLMVVGSALFPQWLFQGLERMEFISIREVAARFIGLMTIFLLVKEESDYLWAAAIMSGSGAIAGLIGLLYVPRITGVRFVRTSFAEVRQTLADGWNIFLSTAAITLYGRSNIVILRFLASDTEVGYYTAATRLIDAAKSLFMPLSIAIYPHISRVAVNSREDAVQFIRRNLFRLSAPFALISLGLLIGAPIGVHLVYGSRFDQAIRLLQIMSPIPFVVALGTSFATYFMLGLGYKKEWSKMIMQAGVLNFVFMVPLLLIFTPAVAISLTLVLVELFVLGRSYWFYRAKGLEPQRAT